MAYNPVAGEHACLDIGLQSLTIHTSIVSISTNLPTKDRWFSSTSPLEAKADLIDNPVTNPAKQNSNVPIPSGKRDIDLGRGKE